MGKINMVPSYQQGGLTIDRVEKAIPLSHKWGLTGKPINIVQYKDDNIKDLAERGVDIPQSLKEGVMVLPEYIHYANQEEVKTANKYRGLIPGRVGTCNEKGCSERARVVLANTVGKDLDWAVKQGLPFESGNNRNNAWDVEHNLIQAGGLPVFSYADNVGGSFKHSKFDDWSKYGVKIGDVVGLHNNEYTDSPISSGKSKNKSRHVGVVVGYGENDIPMVQHNIHGKEYLEPINDIAGSRNHFANYYVNSITRPKGLVEEPIDVESHNKEIKGIKFDPNYDPNYTDTEKGFLSGLNDSKERVMQVTGMGEEDFIKYAQMAFGILQMESDGDREDLYTYLKAKNMASGFREVFTGEEPSKGWTQIKHYPKDKARQLGVTELLDPKQSAIATVLTLWEKDKRLHKHPDYKEKDTDYYLPAAHKNDLGFKRHAKGKSSDLWNYRNKSYDADSYNLGYSNKVMEATQRLGGPGIEPLWDKYKDTIRKAFKEAPMMVDKKYILKKAPIPYTAMPHGTMWQQGGVIKMQQGGLAKLHFKALYGKEPSGAGDMVKVADIESNPTKYGIKAGMLPEVSITAKSEVQKGAIDKLRELNKERTKSSEMVGGKANPNANKMESVNWEAMLMPSTGLAKTLLPRATSLVGKVAKEGLDMVDPTSMGMGLANTLHSPIWAMAGTGKSHLTSLQPDKYIDFDSWLKPYKKDLKALYNEGKESEAGDLLIQKWREASNEAKSQGKVLMGSQQAILDKAEKGDIGSVVYNNDFNDFSSKLMARSDSEDKSMQGLKARFDSNIGKVEGFTKSNPDVKAVNSKSYLSDLFNQYEIKPIKGVASMGFPFTISKKVESKPLQLGTGEFNPEIKEYKDNYEMFKDFNEQGRKQGIAIDRDSEEYQNYLANAHKSREYYVGRDIEALKEAHKSNLDPINQPRELAGLDLSNPLIAKRLGFLHGEGFDDWKRRQLHNAYTKYTPEWYMKQVGDSEVNRGLGIKGIGDEAVTHFEEGLGIKQGLHSNIKSLQTEKAKLDKDLGEGIDDETILTLNSSPNPEDKKLALELSYLQQQAISRQGQLKANEAMIKAGNFLTKFGIKENPYKAYLEGNKVVGDWVSPSNRLSNQEIADGLWLSKRSMPNTYGNLNVVPSNYGMSENVYTSLYNKPSNIKPLDTKTAPIPFKADELGLTHKLHGLLRENMEGLETIKRKQAEAFQKYNAPEYNHPTYKSGLEYMLSMDADLIDRYKKEVVKLRDMLKSRNKHLNPVPYDYALPNPIPKVDDNNWNSPSLPTVTKSMNREHLGKWDLSNPDWHKGQGSSSLPATMKSQKDIDIAQKELIREYESPEYLERLKNWMPEREAIRFRNKSLARMKGSEPTIDTDNLLESDTYGAYAFGSTPKDIRESFYDKTDSGKSILGKVFLNKLHGTPTSEVLAHEVGGHAKDRSGLGLSPTISEAIDSYRRKVLNPVKNRLDEYQFEQPEFTAAVSQLRQLGKDRLGKQFWDKWTPDDIHKAKQFTDEDPLGHILTYSDNKGKEHLTEFMNKFYSRLAPIGLGLGLGYGGYKAYSKDKRSYGKGGQVKLIKRK
jgi:hypothetical protein